MKTKTIAVVGAGLSGAVIARELASAGYNIQIFESRRHIAGNCHTFRDPETHVMVHAYGPHIFHTSNKQIWDYLRKFDEIVPFINRVKAVYNSRVYSLPVNLMTINQFFDLMLSPSQAKLFMQSLTDKWRCNPQNFEEQARCFIGDELYEAFFKGYTQKQWGIHPRDLPSSILKRLPVRFDYNDNYYNSTYQGIPKHGYSYVIKKIIDHSNIEINLNVQFNRGDSKGFDHVFYSGPLDSWFSYSEGHLGYRTLDFISETHDGDYQGNAVINYTNYDVPYTRISEHKHFAPWESHEKTIIYREFSRNCELGDIPYYPIRLANEKDILVRYIKRAETETGVTFVGRLGTYRYLDMHVCIDEALKTSEAYVEISRTGARMPSFVVSPL